MKDILASIGYRLDQSSMIWKKNSFDGIKYSDGEKVENSIAIAIKSVKDKSILSQELKKYCVDWATTYHLSSTRANILRPYENLLAGDVLEIGAGCGAITRYLGEIGGNVLALEGSIHRAQIARLRTEDLANVTVVAESFHEFNPSHKFDAITLIGVLEYSNLFVPSENPALSVLEKVRSLLKPNGKLFIAIENQLGLKYFAGAPEDHLNIPMYGIEGRYEKNQPETYGRIALTNIISKAGFQFVEFMAPFPDYKLPISIVTESGFDNIEFDGAAFAWQSAKSDPQLPGYINFSIELAWPTIFENKLGLELSNSFLICASNELMPKNNILAYHYTADRKPEFCKQLTVEQEDLGDISVCFKALTKNIPPTETEGQPLVFSLPQKQKYIRGRLLSLELISILKKDDWQIEQVATFVRRYIDALCQITGVSISCSSTIDKNMLLPGWCFDLIPQNIVIDGNGSPQLIDVEWSISESMPLGYLLFRAVLNVINKISRFGLHIHRHPFTRRYFVYRAVLDAGVDISESDLDEYTNAEASIQSYVTGRDAGLFKNWNQNELLNTKNLLLSHSEIQSQLIEKSNLLNNIDKKQIDFDNAISEIKESIEVNFKALVDLQTRDIEIQKLMFDETNKIIVLVGQNNIDAFSRLFLSVEELLVQYRQRDAQSEESLKQIEYRLSSLITLLSGSVEASKNEILSLFSLVRKENNVSCNDILQSVNVLNSSIEKSAIALREEWMPISKDLFAAIESSGSSLSLLAKSIESKDEELNQSRERYEDLRERFERTTRELSVQLSLTQEKEKEVSSLTSKNESLIRELSNANSLNEELNTQNEGLIRELFSIKASKWWKIFRFMKLNESGR